MRASRAAYLKINGVWEDHVLHALVSDDAGHELSEAP